MHTYLLAVDTDMENITRQSNAWEKHGILVDPVSTIQEAILKLERKAYIAIGINAGCILFRPQFGILRDTTALPIHIIASDYSIDEHIDVLNRGADVFSVWAENPEENVIRGLAQFHSYHNRRYSQKCALALLTQGDICIYLDYHRVFIGKQEIYLCKKEYYLLVLFMQNRGRVLTPDCLITRCWGYTEHSASDTQLWNQIKNLRAKLRLRPDHFEYIQTVMGFGYRFVAPEDE